MKNTKLLLIYIFLFMYILINNLIVNTPLSKYNNLFITPILLISIAVLSYIVLKKEEI